MLIPTPATPLKLNGTSPAWRSGRARDLLHTEFSFDSMEDALAAFAHGEPIIVMYHESRENEGDILMSASKCTTDAMAWIIKYTSGYICVSLPGKRLENLDIPMMAPYNQERHRTAYTITVDYKHGTTTGISAHDRSLTTRKLVDPSVVTSDFTRPGHMVPSRRRPFRTQRSH
ncbi:hypothetical protein OG21DRAFT_1518044 [Imleria badia]|nr:hypothetical protein OG21DRAFT_1518044 [Imleria badia]